ncbi:MAG: alpha/beta hydrolase [Acidobacteria bacterium]|nr:alpha/beta hydrolase [Acidobacteriota bacterium]
MALAFAGAQPARAQNLTYREVEELPHPPADRRIAYGKDPLQFGELRLPKGKGPHPVAVIIHGGCWLSEYDVRHVGSFAAALTKAGVATWTVEYRRVGDSGGGWPGTFADVARAADYLRVLARSHHLDLKRVVAVGHSAGGQLALWLAARRRLPKSSEMYAPAPLRLRGVVSLAGVTDLKAFGPRCNGAVSKLLGGTLEEFPMRYEQASPAKLLPLRVPQRLIHGAQDGIVPLEQSRAYADAARKSGDKIELTVLDGAGHFDLIAPQSSAWPAIERAVLSLLGKVKEASPSHSSLTAKRR